MSKGTTLIALAVMIGMCAAAQQSEIAKWDPRMAQQNAVVDEKGVKWIDGKFLPIELRPPALKRHREGQRRREVYEAPYVWNALPLQNRLAQSQVQVDAV